MKLAEEIEGGRRAVASGTIVAGVELHAGELRDFEGGSARVLLGDHGGIWAAHPRHGAEIQSAGGMTIEGGLPRKCFAPRQAHRFSEAGEFEGGATRGRQWFAIGPEAEPPEGAAGIGGALIFRQRRGRMFTAKSCREQEFLPK